MGRHRLQPTSPIRVIPAVHATDRDFFFAHGCRICNYFVCASCVQLQIVQLSVQQQRRRHPMPTNQEREEIIRQLLKLLDEIETDSHGAFVLTRIAIAKDLVRKLAEPKRGDGDAS